MTKTAAAERSRASVRLLCEVCRYGEDRGGHRQRRLHRTAVKRRKGGVESDGKVYENKRLPY